MRALDPGHIFELDLLDGDGKAILRFVKREGPDYPGNRGHFPGTIMQEVIRALISRLEYLQGQQPHWVNPQAIEHLRQTLYLLEVRAALRRGELLPVRLAHSIFWAIEKLPTCPQCGHIWHRCMKGDSE